MDIAEIQEKAAKYLAQSRYSEAIELYRQCVGANPAEMSNYWHLGLAWILQGEELEAQAVWLSAIARGTPEEVELWGAELLEVLEAEASRHLQRNPQLAERIYWQIIEVVDSQPEAYYNLGNALSYQGSYDEAIACWQRAIDLQPDFAEAHQNQAEVFEKLGEFEKAISCYLKALVMVPDWTEGYWNLGLCFCRQDKLDEAVACFQKAIQIQPDFAPACGDLGYALLKQGKLDEAVACFRKAIQIQPAFAEAYCQWSDTLAKQGKSKEAIFSNAGLLKTLYSQAESAELYYYLGKAFAAGTQFGEAIACFQKAREINPDLAGAISDFIASQRLQGERDETAVGFPVGVPVDPPQDFYELAHDWAVASNFNDNYTTIYPENTIHLAPPITPDSTIDFRFRFGGQVKLPAAFVALVPDGRYWLDETQTASATIAPDNKLLGDVSPEFPALSPGHPDKHPSKHSIFSSGKFPPLQSFDGTVAVLSGLLNDVYFHWMFDILPRINLLRRCGIDMERIDKFLISSRLPFQRETLNALGIPESKILETSQFPHLKATKLVVPSFSGTIAWMPKWACDFLRGDFLKDSEAPEKIERIYISRALAENRRVINEYEVINLLSKLGFRNVTLESMSVAQQAWLLANAKVVVAPHGGGLTNLVFCQPGTQVIEIFSPNYVYPCYWLVSNIVGLEYYCAFGETLAGGNFHKIICPSPRIEDIFVNLDQLLKVLKCAGLVYI
ncbi:tetratricopeptide repeat protein [Kamptonema formosum]|uniref:tetratricopeptide repeat protein n=1 Tax=Kamptonema formosum TaxID=331992 RepID=UPI000346149F|nr:tetratricopeptide repeat protein [Oscillatoria sp. PCC 10802]